MIVYLSPRSRHRLLVLVIFTWAICFVLPSSLFSIFDATVSWADDRYASLYANIGEGGQAGQDQAPIEMFETDLFGWGNENSKPQEKYYKPAPEMSRPVPDPFPLLSRNPPPKQSLLRAPKANRPPRKHYPEQTPLFVGFTRNWPQLLQCVISYIAAGWPPEDIYVVENTGVMFANQNGNLTLQNPFYLNHTQLGMLGVNVIITPTLLTFSQLQNFYLWTALARSLPYFFWTHEDLVVFTYENDTTPHPSIAPPTLYDNAVSTLRHLTNPANQLKWAHHFFAYDHLTLVNRDAVLSVGGWDTHIPFYASDCDTYVRLMWAGWSQGESDIGLIYDVGSVMEDVGALLRIRGSRASLPGMGDGELGREGERGSDKYVESWERLVELAERMEQDKYAGGNAWRNTWQVKQRGGQGEPFYRDADGFEKGVKMLIDTGRAVFAEKWGHRGCDIANVGIKGGDAWRLERDWDEQTEGLGYEGKSW